MDIIKMEQEDVELYREDIIFLLKENYKINLGNLKELDSFIKEKYKEITLFLADGSAYIILCLDKGQVIAFLWAYERREMQERMMHLTQFIVKKEYRGKGIGTNMLNQLEDETKRRRISVIELHATVDNNIAMQFYEKSKFKVKRVCLRKNIDEAGL